ncbi:MAG: type IV pilus secretin PilQ, partial [Proteobacteria bacterium]
SVRDVIQLIAEQSGANIVLAGGVDGNISLKLKQIPWDQALLIVMKSQGLGYVRQGSVLRISPLKNLRDESEAARQILEAQRAAEPLKVKIIPVSYAKVADLVDRVKPFLTKTRGEAVADIRTSSIIITDTPEIIERVSGLIRSLDTPPLQVLIEGKVVEAREGFTRSFGVNWGASGAQVGLGGGRSINNNLQIASANVNTPNVSYQVRLGTFDIFGDLDANLALAESENLAKVVSAPRVSALNNEPAVIEQTLSTFINKQTIVAGVATNSFEKLDTKLQLAVTPQVTGEGNVIMDLTILREFVSGVPTGTAPAPIESRNAKTKVMVRNGETAVIGGVYQSDVIESEAGVPYLRNLPILGWLFKSRSYQNQKNELIVFLTPRIINIDTFMPAVFRSAPIVALAFVSLMTLTSCGGGEEGAGAANLEFDVLDGGLLLPVDNQTCVDKVEGTGARSARPVSLNFGAIRLKWIPTNRYLYIGLIKITVRSSRIAGGSQVITLPGDEIEALLGAPGQMISPENDDQDKTLGNKAIVSNKSANRNGAPACALNVGGITLSSTSTSGFTANVTIELLGQSSGSDALPDDGTNPVVIRKSYSTTATYY